MKKKIEIPKTYVIKSTNFELDITDNTQTYEIDLSSILPNDNNIYEVYFKISSISSLNTNSSGAIIYSSIENISVMRANYQNKNVQCMNDMSFIIGTDRKLFVKGMTDSNNWNGHIHIYIRPLKYKQVFLGV